MPEGSDYNQSEIITLLVGKYPVVPFKVHEDLLTSKSEYFRAALTHSFIESEEKVVRLGHAKVDSVKSFLDWASTGSFVIKRSVDKNIWAYQFADYIYSEAFCNTIVDTFRSFDKKNNYFTRRRHILKLHDIGLGDSRLAKMILRDVVNASRETPHKWWGTKEKDLTKWVSYHELLEFLSLTIILYKSNPARHL